MLNYAHKPHAHHITEKYRELQVLRRYTNITKSDYLTKLTLHTGDPNEFVKMQTHVVNNNILRKFAQL